MPAWEGNRDPVAIYAPRKASAKSRADPQPIAKHPRIDNLLRRKIKIDPRVTKQEGAKIEE